ncbi:MAG: PKD domain-containing protein [Acidobacteriota bacterium]
MRIGLPPPLVFAFAIVGCLCCGCSNNDPSPTAPTTPAAPSQNGAPRIGALIAAPSGTGLESVTIFTFTGQDVTDPDGDQLTYRWTSSDEAAITSSTQAASHVYDRAGSYEMKLTATDSKGLSTTAAAAVRIGTVSGTWDITCDSRPAGFPAQFVAAVTQIGSALSGTITGAGRTQTFPAPPSVASVNQANDPRQVNFGVEGFYNPWGDSDFYFHLTADAALTAMSGSSQYCGSVAATRR